MLDLDNFCNDRSTLHLTGEFIEFYGSFKYCTGTPATPTNKTDKILKQNFELVIK